MSEKDNSKDKKEEKSSKKSLSDRPKSKRLFTTYRPYDLHYYFNGEDDKDVRKPRISKERIEEVFQNEDNYIARRKQASIYYKNKYLPLEEKILPPIKRYVGVTEIYDLYKWKTWNQGESYKDYIKENFRSDHNYAISVRNLRLLVKVFWEKVCDKIMRADSVETPMGIWTMYYTEITHKYNVADKSKVFNQIDMHNRSPYPVLVYARMWVRKYLRASFTREFKKGVLFPFLKKNDNYLLEFTNGSDRSSITREKRAFRTYLYQQKRIEEEEE